MKWFFKSNFFLLLEYSGHEYILDCYSSTRVPTLVLMRLVLINVNHWLSVKLKSHIVLVKANQMITLNGIIILKLGWRWTYLKTGYTFLIIKWKIKIEKFFFSSTMLVATTLQLIWIYLTLNCTIYLLIRLASYNL